MIFEAHVVAPSRRPATLPPCVPTSRSWRPNSWSTSAPTRRRGEHRTARGSRTPGFAQRSPACSATTVSASASTGRSPTSWPPSSPAPAADSPVSAFGRAPSQSFFWARTFSGLRLSAPRSPHETDRAQIDGTTASPATDRSARPACCGRSVSTVAMCGRCANGSGSTPATSAGCYGNWKARGSSMSSPASAIVASGSPA